jgi:hypothetical protein
MTPSRYSGRNSEECVIEGLSPLSVTGTAETILSADKVNLLRLVVPTDQPAVRVANQGDITSGATGFVIPSGVGIVLSPYQDPVIAITPDGSNSTIYYSTES